MARQPRGLCAFCRHETTKAAMGKHLGTCAARQQRIAATKSRKPQSLIHLRIQDEYAPPFWFDVEVDGTASLGDIDSYLRSIWLECCGTVTGWSLTRTSAGPSLSLEPPAQPPPAPPHFRSPQAV